MPLTSPQLATLKAFILADSALNSQPMTNLGGAAIAAVMNTAANPAYIVWKTKVTKDEIQLNGFDWTRLDNLSVGLYRVWFEMFDNDLRAINPSKTNIRSGIESVWAGTAADLAVRAAVYVHCKRSATVAEKLFTSGAGTTATPSLLVFEGNLTFDDVVQARELP